MSNRKTLHGEDREFRDTAVVFTCDDCTDEYYPTRPPRKISELGVDGLEEMLASYPSDPHVCVVRKDVAYDFLADGRLTVVEDTYLELACPHVFCAVKP